MLKEKCGIPEKALYRRVNAIMQCIRGLFGIRTLNAVGFLKKQKYADVLCNEVDKYRSEYLVVRIHRAQARAKMAKRQHARQRYARKQTRGATK